MVTSVGVAVWGYVHSALKATAVAAAEVPGRDDRGAGQGMHGRELRACA